MPDRSEGEHLAVLQALRARDAQAARDAMAIHLDTVIGIFSRT